MKIICSQENKSKLNTFISTKNKNIPSSQNQTKNTIDEENDFPNYKLENIKEYVEDIEIKMVREEREREWKRQEEENKKKAILEQVKLEILKNEARLKMKDLDGKMVTFDANGAVININNVNVEKLTVDFYQPKYNIKLILDSKLRKYLIYQLLCLINQRKATQRINSVLTVLFY